MSGDDESGSVRGHGGLGGEHFRAASRRRNDGEAFAAREVDDTAVTDPRARAPECAGGLAARLVEEAGDPDIG